MKKLFHKKHNVHDERGDALVLVITSIFLIGIVVTSLVTITVAATAKAAATRAHSQALAAAEGGIEVTARMLISESTSRPACNSSYTSAAGTQPQYSITVEYMPASGTTYQPCNGAQLPANAKAVRFVSTGTAQDAGSQRNATRNTATVERVFERPNKGRFNEAIFGDVEVETNSTYVLHPDRGPDGTGSGLDSNIVTNGLWKCPANSKIAGNVVALGGAVTSTNCIVGGDLHVVGNLTASSKVSVQKNLFVNGNLASSSSNLYVDENVLVHGDVKFTNDGNKVLGDLRATGKYTTTSPDSINNFIGGTAYFGQGLAGSGWTYNELTSRSGAKLKLNQSTAGEAWSFPSIMTDTKTPEEIERLTFPFITKTDEMFNGFHRTTWKDIGLANNIFQGSNCGSIGLQGTLVINENTFMDGTDCPGLTFGYGNLTIELNADAVLYVKSFSSSINVNIVAGPNASTDNRHTLYIMVAPHDDPSRHTCKPIPGNVGSLRLATGTWDTSPKNGRLGTKLMLYSAGEAKLTLTNSNVTSGQIYGCKVSFPSSFTMTYAKSGPEANNNLLDLKELWTRDITF
ncbi:polymer-forming cytoskeletal protein [Timonella sp. A28]|uniref:polymer-forming cytoskeletal protein n=1 Tax=Timonella sp. A28 TaxID=3442640 RepID=UPI003EC00B05